ncbi:MAG TPA: tRNA (N6-isopentenyl adenosine(37)-C2)-methylthiotransferase MiaB [Candidatus Tectomicrobia bacterium]|jgi:tRNA-2-methylthio-N6-dimethylallyladenosine synthase|nr:tRNA (N6-isopentenyl adenosine(37)-C2)-methylthiotransferase MiaB [Candidatus Tectomicrobia bacterium]
MDQKRAAVITYGCQMNKYESERIAGILVGLGYEITEDARRTDLILFNTCSIRDKAEQKVYSQLGHLKWLKRDNPELIIGVCGCVAQQEGDRILQRIPHVDLVFGPQNIPKLPSLLGQVRTRRQQLSNLADNPLWDEQLFPIHRGSPFQAWVTVMQGCDKFCTFCVVPYTRGREQSRPTAAVVHEVQTLAEQGYQEVTLLGQNIDSYGKRSPEGKDLADLLALLQPIDGIKRIRFITSHPRDFTEKLMRTVGALEKVCEYIHLPVQAGSSAVLKRMHRGYTREDYLAKVEQLRALVPDLALSTDVIVGFPGETDDDFAETLRLVEAVEFDSMYSFKYSPRPGTRAASFSDQVPEAVKTERFKALLEVQEAIQLRRNQARVGRCEEVLVEGPSKKGSVQLTGRTRQNRPVNFVGHPSLIGSLVTVHIDRGGTHSLEGKVCTDRRDRGGED